jgi:excinuclease ABC subunit A
MPPDYMRIVNATLHNLKGVTVDLPRRKLIVVTGPSGSGKSSLAFDTLYAEGQRRYIESLSTYAKQFLERMAKPPVDLLEGLAPAVAIEQRNPTVSNRSTVGTATEVYDYLRLLWARVGTTWCVACGELVRRDTPQSAAATAEAAVTGKFQVVFPLPSVARGNHAAAVENLLALGFVRIVVDGVAAHLNAVPRSMSLARADEVLVVVDRLAPGPDARARTTEAISLAFLEGEGVALVIHAGERLRFTEGPTCSACDTPAATQRPTLFSFNNPQGACSACNGFGAILEYHESLIVPDPDRSLAEGAIDPWTKPRYGSRLLMISSCRRQLPHLHFSPGGYSG